MKENYYTEEERYWLTGGNTGTLPTRISPFRINNLRYNEIFVFGSTCYGIHTTGLANIAYRYYGAKLGVNEGLQGRSYAIPSKVPLAQLETAVQHFTLFAKQNPKLKFYVTPIGCGGAGYNAHIVAPYFRDAAFLSNVYLPLDFWKVIINK